MCLVVINNEIKKSCCNCGGLCKREQKWAEKMSQMNTVDETVDLALLLREAQALQQHNALQKAG
jgi:hypothetical protein